MKAARWWWWLGLGALALLAGLIWLVAAPLFEAADPDRAGGPGSADASGLLIGFVIDGHSGQPVTAARVALTCGGALERATTTDEAGGFSFEKLPDADCTLTARAEGHLAGGRARAASLEVGVESGLRLADLVLTLYRESSVSGRVLDGQRPVSGARLSLLYLEAPGEQEAFNLDLEVESEADGAFEVAGLGPGRLHVLAEANGFALAESREVFLRSGDAIADLDIQLRAEATLGGVVRDRGGRPIAGAQVRLLAQDNRQPRLAVSGEDGRFLFERLPPGPFRLSARAPGYRSAPTQEGTLSAGALAERTIVLEAVPGISGRVVDPQGSPVAYAAVFIAAKGQERERGEPATRARADGRFWLPGPFDQSPLPLWAGHPRFGPSEIVPVDPGQDGVIILRLGQPGRLRGRVLTSGGSPVTSFEVLAYGHRDEAAVRASAAGFTSRMVRDAGGKFELDQLAPGAYTIEIQAAGFTTARKTALLVRSGATTEAGTIYLSAGGTVSGLVVDRATGRPVAGARIRSAGMSHTFPRAMTDAEGRFRLVGVPAERLSVWIHARSYASEMISGVRAPSEGELDLGTIRLEPVGQGGHGAMNYAGVGAVLKMQDDGTLSVDRLMEGAPAANGGLVEGSRILRVDGLDVRDLGLRRAVELIRGEAGTEVSLDVLLPGSAHPQTVRVERDRVQSP